MSIDSVLGHKACLPKSLRLSPFSCILPTVFIVGENLSVRGSADSRDPPRGRDHRHDLPSIRRPAETTTGSRAGGAKAEPLTRRTRKRGNTFVQ
jgi:hypothetical protein